MNEELEKTIQRAEAEYIRRFAEGPEKVRWSELPPQVGEPAPDIQVLDSTGSPRHISEFWEGGPALLLFWRHFGCGIGIERAVSLSQEYARYIDAGANVAIVGEGEPEQAATYAHEHDLACSVLCDPDGVAHETYGLLEFTPPQLLYWMGDGIPDQNPEAAEQFAAEAKEEVGYPQVDNPWRQPGEFVVDTDGEIRLAYRYQYAEDLPDPQLLETVIRQAK